MQSNEQAPVTEGPIRIGDLVVLMSEPGPFLVVDMNPPSLVIESPQGTRRTVREWVVRRVDASPPVPR